MSRFARNTAETVSFHKIHTPGNLVKLQYFTQCLNERKLVLWKKALLFPFSHKGNVQLGPENDVCFKKMSD